MEADTDMGGAESGFPLTQGVIVGGLASPDPEQRQQALTNLITAYWKPVYKYIRWNSGLANEDAKDMTQAFFARVLKKGFLARFDPARARFRTYLRVCLDRFLVNERKSAQRIKRGGGQQILSLDFAEAEGEYQRGVPADRFDMDEFFRQEWVRHLFSLAVEDLRAECEMSGRTVAFALFQRLDLETPHAAERSSYESLANEFGLSVTQVTNYLALARRRFRQRVLERMRASTGSEAEFQEETHRLLGDRFA